MRTLYLSVGIDENNIVKVLLFFNNKSHNWDIPAVRCTYNKRIKTKTKICNPLLKRIKKPRSFVLDYLYECKL